TRPGAWRLPSPTRVLFSGNSLNAPQVRARVGHVKEPSFAPAPKHAHASVALSTLSRSLFRYGLVIKGASKSMSIPAVDSIPGKPDTYTTLSPGRFRRANFASSLPFIVGMTVAVNRKSIFVSQSSISNAVSALPAVDA